MSTTVCLAMIVRDESEVISRCLNSIKSHVDAFAIVDTGSKDDTIPKILTTMQGVPGEVVERPWEGMTKSRNAALELARTKKCDYILMLDADDVWIPEDDFVWPMLSEEAYQVKFMMGRQTWHRPALMRSNVPWMYAGIAHEHLTGGARVQKRIDDVVIDARPDGHRRKTEGTEKYNRIAATLEEALANDPTNNRNMFYLAQSYRDAGRTEDAVEWYRKRVEGGGWAEEVWFSKLQIAVLLRKLEKPAEEVFRAFEDAYEYRPTRVEPLAEAAFFARTQKRPALGFMYASAAVGLPPTTDILFVDEGAHWRAMDELAVCAHKIGRIDIAIETNMNLLKREDIPEHTRARITGNGNAAIREGQRLLESA